MKANNILSSVKCAPLHLISSSATEAGLLAKIREYKSDLSNSAIPRASSRGSRRLMPSRPPGRSSSRPACRTHSRLTVSSDQRRRLMMTSERLNQFTDRIGESQRTILERQKTWACQFCRTFINNDNHCCMVTQCCMAWIIHWQK